MRLSFSAKGCLKARGLERTGMSSSCPPFEVTNQGACALSDQEPPTCVQNTSKPRSKWSLIGGFLSQPVHTGIFLLGSQLQGQRFLGVSPRPSTNHSSHCSQSTMLTRGTNRAVVPQTPGYKALFISMVISTTSAQCLAIIGP